MHNQNTDGTEPGTLHGRASAVMARLLSAEVSNGPLILGDLCAAGNDGSPSHSSRPGGRPGSSGGAADPVTPLRKQLGGLRTPGRASGHSVAPATDSPPPASGRCGWRLGPLATFTSPSHDSDLQPKATASIAVDGTVREADCATLERRMRRLRLRAALLPPRHCQML